jgi:hypothetical protein
MNNSSRQKEAVLNVFAAVMRPLMRIGRDQPPVPVRPRIVGWAEAIARARSAASINSAAQRSGSLALAM